MKLSKGFIILQCFLALAGRSIATYTSKIREDNQRKVVNLSHEVEIPASIALSSPITDFTSLFSYYDYFIGDERFIVADTLTDENRTCALTIKVILSPDSYRFYVFPNLAEENAVVEFLLKDGKNLKKYEKEKQ